VTSHDVLRGAPDVTLADRCMRWATVKPEALCLTSGDVSRTWAEIMERCARIASGLRSIGQDPGMRILYVGRNSAAFIELMIASSMIGTVITAVNWRLAAPEMREVVEHSTAEVAFVEEEFAELWAAVGPAAGTRTVTVGAEGPDDYERWVLSHDPLARTTPSAPDDVALQMYTSGTTGVPKGAVFSHAALQGIDVSADAMGIAADATVLIVIPLFHAGGAVAAMIALRSGAHLVVSAETSADALAAAIERHRISALTLVPTIMRELVSRPSAMSRDLSSLEVVTYCGSPISPDLLEMCLQRFSCDLVQVYGLTEVNGVSMLGVEDHLDSQHPGRLRSAGRELPGVVVRVVDPESGMDVPEGATGEIWVKAPTAMSGYFRAPDQTSDAITPDGFVRTGDGGFLRDGYLYLRDRIKDMIITGGENVYPVEVEKVLHGCQGVEEVAVVGVPSEVWGESVKAFVVPTSVGATTAEAVMAYARRQLAGYKCPKSVELVTALPRNASGKLLKRVIRDPDWVDAHRASSVATHQGPTAL
jgi:long-chain acyl-CoA synthetase